MPLTDRAIKKAKPADKPYKLADEKGLYLLVSATGKHWRMDYRFDTKRKTLALGAYPTVSLVRARKKRDEARKRICTYCLACFYSDDRAAGTPDHAGAENAACRAPHRRLGEPCPHLGTWFTFNRHASALGQRLTGIGVLLSRPYESSVLNPRCQFLERDVSSD